jgi:ubiquinone/menaquinone biosynthesis C-methylase UbiE
MVNVWDNLYRDKAESFRHYPNEELVRFLGRTYFKNRSQERCKAIRILELGCGNGANLWALAKEGFDVYGLDGSQRALELACETLEKWDVHADLNLGDVRSLPYADGWFDAVVDIGTLQCLTFTDLKKAYREAKRVLRENGWFFSYHYGRGTWDYDHGGGTLIDRHTFDNISNPEAIFPNIGTICMPEVDDVEGLLRSVGFQNSNIETVVKSYNGRAQEVQYLVISCTK